MNEPRQNAQMILKTLMQVAAQRDRARSRIDNEHRRKAALATLDQVEANIRNNIPRWTNTGKLDIKWLRAHLPDEYRTI